jgi:hypothetical protein
MVIEEDLNVRAVRVSEADYQSMKLKFVRLNVVRLAKVGNATCWILTDAGKAFLMGDG